MLPVRWGTMNMWASSCYEHAAYLVHHQSTTSLPRAAMIEQSSGMHSPHRFLPPLPFFPASLPAACTNHCSTFRLAWAFA